MGVVCGGKVEFGSGAGLLPQKRLSIYICNKNFKVRQVGPQGATLSTVLITNILTKVALFPRSHPKPTIFQAGQD